MSACAMADGVVSDGAGVMAGITGSSVIVSELVARVVSVSRLLAGTEVGISPVNEALELPMAAEI